MGVGRSCEGVVAHDCGCESHPDGNHVFCENPKHKKDHCGCYNIGGNKTLCDSHQKGILSMLVVLLVVALIVVAAS